MTQSPKSPNLLSFLPMLYVAWADDILTEGEAKRLQEKVEAQDWLTEEEREQLSEWFDPNKAPSPQTLNEWLRIIRTAATQMPDEQKQTLVVLGKEMARISSEGTDLAVESNEGSRALSEIEEALGIVSSEATRDLLLLASEAEEKESKTSFSPEEMQKLLEADKFEFRQEIKKVLSEPGFNLEIITDKAEYRERVLDWVKKTAEKGWGALAYPVSCGGENDMRAYVALFETMGYHDLSMAIKFGVQFGLFGMSVQALGTDYHHQTFLKDIGTLELPGCFAMTEDGHGSNVRDIETTATYDTENGEFIIHTPVDSAHKTYIGNAALHGQAATVFAQLSSKGEDFGVHAFVVPIRDKQGNVLEGVRIEDCGEKLGLNGVDNGRIWFEKVRIPRKNLLDRFAQVSEDGTYSSPISSPSKRFFTMLGTLVGGRVCVPMAGLSATKKALNLAIRYAAQRRQFGRENEAETLILDYQTHQRRLFIPLAKTYALHFAHRYMTERYLKKTEEESREIESLAAGLKAVSTWHATHTIQTCREACGGNGYLAENQFAALKADTEIFTTFEGDNTVLLQLVAKSRLSTFKQQFHDLKFMGLVRYIADQATTAIIELNPLAIRNIDSEHLRDGEFHKAAFRYRAEVSLSAVAKRLKKRLDAGMDSYEAFIQTQQHLVEMAEAYIDDIVITQFYDAIEHCESVSLKEMLNKLAGLYALSTIEKQRGWFLEYGYIEGIKSKAIQREINTLCRELRPDAVALVDAFGIPQALLGAPMIKS